MLNETELKVLNAALDVIQYETGGQFGFTSDVKVEGLTKSSTAGYLSQLVQKGMLLIWTEQVQATELGVKTAGRDEWFEL